MYLHVKAELHVSAAHNAPLDKESERPRGGREIAATATDLHLVCRHARQPPWLGALHTAKQCLAKQRRLLLPAGMMSTCIPYKAEPHVSAAQDALLDEEGARPEGGLGTAANAVSLRGPAAAPGGPPPSSDAAHEVRLGSCRLSDQGGMQRRLWRDKEL